MCYAEGLIFRLLILMMIFRDNKEKEFTTMCASPSGQALCVGSYDR